MNISTILPLALVVVSTCGQLALASSSPHPFGCEAKEGAEVNSDVREFSPLIIKSARVTSVKDWQTRETAAITKNSGFVLNDVTKDDWIYVTLTAKE